MPTCANTHETARAAALLWHAAGIATLIFAATATASAQVSVDTPPGCGSEAELRGELARLLGPDAPRAEPLYVHIGAPQSGDAEYALELEVQGERRALHDRDCRALFKAALVVAASVVQPARVQPIEPDRERAPVPQAAIAHEKAARAAATPVMWRAHADLGAGATLGVVPALGPRFELAAGVEHGAFGALLALNYSMPEEKRAGDGHGLRAWALGGRVGATFAPIELLRVAAGIEIDRLRGSGLGSDHAQSDSVWMVAPLLEAALVPLQHGRLRLELALDGHYALLRPSFEILGYGEVFRVARVGGSAIARLGWQFH